MAVSKKQDDNTAIIRDAYKLRDAELRASLKRSLPFQDAMFDRWERARTLGFGDGTSIYNSATVFDDVQVGCDTWIGPNVMLDGSGGGIQIGSTCSISSGVQIFTHDTIGWALSGGKLDPRHAPVSIGSRCYIGSHSVIAAGVTIEDGCVVAANSFVNSNVSSGTIVGGSPAKRLGVVVVQNDRPILVFDNGGRTELVGERYD